MKKNQPSDTARRSAALFFAAATAPQQKNASACRTDCCSASGGGTGAKLRCGLRRASVYKPKAAKSATNLFRNFLKKPVPTG